MLGIWGFCSVSYVAVSAMRRGREFTVLSETKGTEVLRGPQLGNLKSNCSKALVCPDPRKVHLLLPGPPKHLAVTKLWVLNVIVQGKL